MRETLTCPACSGGRIWHVARMLEQNENGRMAPLAVGSVAPVETYICDECGYTAWYTNAAPGPLATGHACAECGSVDLAQVGTLREEHGQIPIHITLESGRIQAAVCRQCTRLRFTAIDAPLWELVSTDQKCRWCQDAVVETYLLIHEKGPWRFVKTLPIAFHQRWYGEERRGGFALRICRGCGDTEWHAERLQDLRDDPLAGVKLLERKKAVGGPYR